MIPEIFLTCALSLPTVHHSRPAIVSYQMAKSEEDRLIDWLRINNPDAEVFIHHEPQEDRLKNDHWERVPFSWNGKQIWIKRKPRTDYKQRVETSA